MFRVTSRLLECRITLFTRPNCSLCDTAKAVVRNVREQTPFTYQEIEVMKPGQEKWKGLYEFDTPVIHIDKANATETTASARKLMHRFKEEDVGKLIEEVDQS